ncbi:MAG TPA: 4-hydroxyphenylacetate 3-hydroxylase N-terminal domain-containing protein [Reyranella sp.]|nr:4-hydroxyphenylacetate 3-hydroxylase N-terminal domain-containing protein [Reyranella sp.]
MGLKTPQQYIESLRDGRVTYWDGERIDDITTHPRFRVPIALTAVDYEYDAADYGALRRYRTETGEEAHRIYQVPTSEADLATRVELLQHTSIGTAVSGVYMALMSVKDDVAQVNPQCAANIERMYRYCRDNDLRAAEVITDPKGDRKCRAHEQDDPDLYVRIVDRSFAPAALNEFDYPASAHHSMPEGFVVFDDVLVPWDRVFLAGEVQLASRLAQSLGLWERTGGVIEAVRLSELFVGLAQLVSEHQGKERDPVVMNTIAELITYAEMLRMSLDYACRHFEQSPSGMVFPNVLGDQRGEILLCRQLPPDGAPPARSQRRAGADLADGGRPAPSGGRPVHPQVPAHQAGCRRRGPHAGLQPDPRPHRRCLWRLAVRGGTAGRRRLERPTHHDEPHLRPGARQGTGAGRGRGKAEGSRQAAGRRVALQLKGPS